MKLTGQTVLITGGSSGIGLELAIQLEARGNTVIVTGRSKEKLAALRSKQPKIHAIESDVNAPHAIESLHAEVLQKFPALNILVNNAGIMRRLNLHDTSTELSDVSREIVTNFVGPVQMVKQFLPHLKAQKSAVIINVSSGLAFVPFPLSPVYAATKAALHSYTQSLRVQLQHTRVKVIELAPPSVDTPINDAFGEADVDRKMMMKVDKLVHAAIVGIERDADEIVPGPSAFLRFLGRWAPGVAALMFKKPVLLMLAESKQ